MTICVIGAGPAGLFAAIEAANRGAEVYILEKNSLPGRKLLITGSGQCNLTHQGSPVQLLSHMGPAGTFLKPAFYSWTSDDTRAFFADRGVATYAEEQGKVFPKSRKASDVLEALVNQCRTSKVRIICGAAVSRIEEGFCITCRDHSRYRAERVILASGGASYPATGSAGDGYSLARSLGHEIVEPKPALCAVEVSDHILSNLSGLSFRKARMSLYRNNKKILSHQDDLLITPRGYSGPAILNRSRYMEAGDVLEFDFTSDGRLSSSLSGGITVQTLVQRSGIPRRMAETLLEAAGIPGKGKAAETSKEKLRRIEQMACSFRCTISSPGTFPSAMVSAGGVSRREINRKTMESTLVPGLFFAGEVIDIDGETGGYNLQAAWSTGMAAGIHSAQLSLR